MTIKERITKAKVQLLVYQPWFGQLACYINPIEEKSVPVAGINARGDFFYNKDKIAKLSDQELMGLICHEIEHLAYQHPWRLENRNPEVFNIAADLKVNSDILETKLKLPPGGLFPHYGEFELGDIKIKDIDKKTTEQIYQEIYNKATKINVSSFVWDLIEGHKRQRGKGIGKAKTKGKGKNEDSLKRLEVSGEEKEMLRNEWQQRVNAANQTAKGNMPGGLADEIRAMENPQLPWYRILRQRWLSRRRTYTWRKVNKKFLPFYFPGVTRNKEISAVVAFDTSGSMSNNQLQKALTELYGLAKKFQFVDIDVLMCDTEISSAMKMNSQNWRKFKQLKMKGRGGTDFRPVFRWIEKNVTGKKDILLFFTDGYGEFPDKAPRYDVFWVTFPDSKDVDWPFGRVLMLK